MNGAMLVRVIGVSPGKSGLSEANSREELLVWGWGIIIAYSKIYLMESEVELGCRVTSRLN